MMDKKESTFWTSLSKSLPGFTVRIENTCSRGTPDVHMSFKGLSCWIELKVDEGSGTFLRPEQLAFATMTARNEGHYFVVSHLFADEAVGVWHFPFDHIFDETKKLYLITAYPQFLTEKRQQRKILDFIYEFKSPAITQERHTNA